MSDILCLYYSRSGNTRQTMAEIAEALEAELVEFTDILHIISGCISRLLQIAVISQKSIHQTFKFLIIIDFKPTLLF